MSDPKPFAHLDAPLAAVYRSVLDVFSAGKRRFIVHLRPEDVVEALRHQGAAVEGAAVEAEAVEKALASLAEWGNLRADPDTSRVTTVEDFYRARHLYQLTREGEACERALEVYEATLGRRGELQAVALEDIRVRLRALLAQVDAPDAAVVHNLLLDLAARLDSLAGHASAFVAGLQRLIDLQDIEEEAFLAYKDRLIAYLERFISELVVKGHDIATSLAAFSPAAVERLLACAAAREAADVAPDGAGADPTSAKLAEWRGRWAGLQAWFTGDRLHPSQASLLRQRARKAIPDLLAAVSALQERRSGRTDRSADFRELARWFAAAPSDADAHRLWRVAFGLAPARHLSGVAEALVPASTAWAQAPPVEIAARLRATGHYQRRGRVSGIADCSKDRAKLGRQIAAERAQTEAARRRLATGKTTRLRDIGTLDRDAFGLFVAILGEALAAGPPDASGAIRTRTADGALEIVLRPLPDAERISIETPDGIFRGPDHEITIRAEADAYEAAS